MKQQQRHETSEFINSNATWGWSIATSYGCCEGRKKG